MGAEASNQTATAAPKAKGTHVNPPTPKSKERHIAIEKRLDEDCRKQSDVHQICIVGTPNSGAQTIFKQFVLQFETANLCTKKDNRRYISVANVRKQIIVYSLLFIPKLLSPNDTLNSDLIQSYQYLHKFNATTAAAAVGDTNLINNNLNRNNLSLILKALIVLWRNNAFIINRFMRRQLEFENQFPMQWCIDELERFFSIDYSVTELDHIRIHNPKHLILSTFHKVNNTTAVDYKLIPNNLLRYDRLGRVLVFMDSAKAVLFVSSMIAMCEPLSGRTSNAMQFSLEMFQTIANHSRLRHQKMIVLLNKYDLFSQWIKNGGDMSEYFPDYKGAVFRNPIVQRPQYTIVSQHWLRLSRFTNTAFPSSLRDLIVSFACGYPRKTIYGGYSKESEGKSALKAALTEASSFMCRLFITKRRLDSKNNQRSDPNTSLRPSVYTHFITATDSKKLASYPDFICQEYVMLHSTVPPATTTLM